MNKDYILLIVLFTLLMIVLLFITSMDSNYDLNIYAFNAGKADSFIISKDDKVVIIDTGEKKLYDKIDKYLKNKNVAKIDYLIISHFDKDHVGSASKIIDNYEIGTVYQSNYPKDTDPYNNYQSSLISKGIEPVTVREKISFSVDDMDFEIIPPEKEVYNKDPSNNSSLIVSIKYKNTSYLFTGDIENDRIEEFVNYNTSTYDFLKVPYHGHYQTKFSSLVENVKPKYAVITSSLLRMEDKKVIKILEENSVNYYLTRKGNVVISSDGDSIKIVYE